MHYLPEVSSLFDESEQPTSYKSSHKIPNQTKITKYKKYNNTSHKHTSRAKDKKILTNGFNEGSHRFRQSLETPKVELSTVEFDQPGISVIQLTKSGCPWLVNGLTQGMYKGKVFSTILYA